MKVSALQKAKGWRAVLLAIFSIFLVCFIARPPVERAKAASNGSATVHSYTVDARIESDGRVYVEETLDMTVHIYANMFYRSLPMESDRFFNIQASCDGNDEFSVVVEDNPDVDGFMDICCYGGIEPNNRWTYRFSYVMQVSGGVADGMIIDFVGGGWPFALNNVTVNVAFPAELVNYEIYSNKYGESGNEYVIEKSKTSTSLSLFAETLPIYYESVYGDYVAVPITVDFQLADGGLAGYLPARIFSDGLWLAITLALVCSALFAAVFFKMRKVREVATVVNLKPPQGMDPMRMGKFIDASVDNEDVTSMIYYFASQGYLTVSMENDEPVLICTGKPMPSYAPAYEKRRESVRFRPCQRILSSCGQGANATFGERRADVRKEIATGRVFGRRACRVTLCAVPLFDGYALRRTRLRLLCGRDYGISRRDSVACRRAFGNEEI